METPSEPTFTRNISEHKPRRRLGSVYALQTSLAIAVLVATLFVAFSPSSLSGNFSEQLALLLENQENTVVLPGGTPRPNIRIGIVAGHYAGKLPPSGIRDTGAVCDNGTTEVDTNLKIANLVQQKLGALGFETDLLEEFDPRLNGYHAALFVSIHNYSCEYVNDQATGFKVAAAMSSRDLNLANRLAGCLRERYQRATNLPLHNSVTDDMTRYHAFSAIDPNTTAAIIETGFLNLDYKILTENTDVVATGVANGILCFIYNENIEPTPTP